MEKYLTNFNNKVENILRYYDSNIHIFLVIFELAFFGYFWHFLDLKQKMFVFLKIGQQYQCQYLETTITKKYGLFFRNISE